MSGIFGIIRAPGATVTNAELAPMAETLKHRGPDGISYFARDNAGIGQCMLHSTPEALHEVLPFRDEASGLTLTADARIDNRGELLAKLGLRPAPDKVITDSQLILHAYQKWGERCVEHLLGDFVFAIWDESAQCLFVARDHLGCKPFYYHCGDGLFVFASSALAVARVPQVKATLNEGRLADFLVQELEGIDKTCSWFNEISRMPPAQNGWFRDNAFKCRQYWELQPADLSQLKTDDDYLEAFTEVYTEAVRCRLRCNTEPASMLSGGLDSSTIVAIARDLMFIEGKSPLRTYSAIADPGSEICNETRCVEAVIEQGKLSPVCWSPSGSLAIGEKILDSLAVAEDPFDTLMMVPALMYQSAAADGIKVVLDGIDGDLAIGLATVYPAYLLRDGCWREAWTEVQGLSRHFYRGSKSAVFFYFIALMVALVPNRLKRLRRSITSKMRFQRLFKTRRLTKTFVYRTLLYSRFIAYEKTLGCGLQPSLIDAHIKALQVPYLTAGIERYERVAALFGVDGRHPLLDIRVLQFATALPGRQKVRAGWSKYILRQLADKCLPHSVAWREGWEHLGWTFTTRFLEASIHPCAETTEVLNLPFTGSLDPLMCKRNSFFDFGQIVDQEQHYFDIWQLRCADRWIEKAKNL